MDFVKIKHLLTGYVFKTKGSGLLKTPKDPRDFNTQVLGWGFSYTPKEQRKVIQTLGVKNQGSKNTCTWNAASVQKEIDEQVGLSPRSIVVYGVHNGLVTADGLASLDGPQKALQNWGIAESYSIPEDINDWGTYEALDISGYFDNAQTHRTKTYWTLNGQNDVIKAIDDGKVVTTGLDWYTGFNQGGGFSSPWLITKPVGWVVGGHSVAIIGYDLNYQGHKVYVIQNSYGPNWGDNGTFYVDMAYLDGCTYGYYANLDIPLDEAKKLNIKNMLKSILRDGKGGLWFIKGTQKQRITSIEGVLTAYTVEFGVETNDSKLSALQETNKFFPV